MASGPEDEIGAVARAAIEAAVLAPSVHNTQPWSFAVEGDEISVRADPDRGLHAGDPEGRELLISCGAALLNVRLTLGARGYRPAVRLLPDPDRPSLLATVRFGPRQAELDEHIQLLYGEVPRRRTHRGDFRDTPLPRGFVDVLCREVSVEGARLTPVMTPPAIRVLASITRAAEEVQAQNQAFSLELLRWARSPESTRADGVPPASYPVGHSAHDNPEAAFPARDYARGRRWGHEVSADQLEEKSAGVVVVLTTQADARQDWLAAGQGLQRALLLASAYGVRAAFHTQALEFPLLREFLREELCSGEWPQMIGRFGITSDESASVRRPLSEVFDG